VLTIQYLNTISQKFWNVYYTIYYYSKNLDILMKYSSLHENHTYTFILHNII